MSPEARLCRMEPGSSYQGAAFVAWTFALRIIALAMLHRGFRKVVLDWLHLYPVGGGQIAPLERSAARGGQQ